MRPVVTSVVSIGHGQYPATHRSLVLLSVQLVDAAFQSDLIRSRLGKGVPHGQARPVTTPEVVDGGDEIEEPGTALVE